MFIHKNVKKHFIVGIKANRTVALSGKDKKYNRYHQVQDLAMNDGQSKKVWLRGGDFPVRLIKKGFTNEDGSTGVLYLVASDLSRDAESLYETSQKRWGIEVYHKSIKQNASLAKSPTKRPLSQANHLFASIVAFCKLECLKLKTATNHFALKTKLLLAANQAAMKQLLTLYSNPEPA